MTFLYFRNDFFFAESNELMKVEKLNIFFERDIFYGQIWNANKKRNSNSECFFFPKQYKN